MKACVWLMAMGLASTIVVPVIACEPPVYFLFHEDAQVRLGELEDDTTAESSFSRLILMHNLAFNKDRQMRELAERLLQVLQAKYGETPLLQAYAGSLQMLKISHRSIAVHLIRKAVGKSPYIEARQGFQQISQAMKQDTANLNIRFLRLTAAVESLSDSLDFFSEAQEDLDWLENHIEPTDSAANFFLQLCRGKHHYRCAEVYHQAASREKAIEAFLKAQDYACREDYNVEVCRWQLRAGTLVIKK